MHLRLDLSTSRTHGRRTYSVKRHGSVRSAIGARNLNRSKRLLRDDLEELKACIELGFGFDSQEIDPKLRRNLPALEFYHALHMHQFSKNLTERDDAEVVKMRLKKWAQLVACAVRKSSSFRQII